MTQPGSPETDTFTQSFEALDTLLERFRQESPPLEESLALFEQGVQHIRNCQDKLNKAKGTVEELVQSLREDGEAITQPFEDA